MFRMILLLAGITGAAALSWGMNEDGDAADKAAIERAAMDYVESFYDVKPELIERSVSPELTKYGFYMSDGSDTYTGTGMDFEGAKSLASRWNKDGRQDLEGARLARTQELPW